MEYSRCGSTSRERYTDMVNCQEVYLHFIVGDSKEYSKNKVGIYII